MERYTMLLDWVNQHCQNDSTTQDSLQIQYNSYQIAKDILHRTGIKNFKFCMQTQKTLNNQNSLEKEK